MILGVIICGAEVENWILVDMLVRDWNTVVGMKGCCPESSEGADRLRTGSWIKVWY